MELKRSEAQLRDDAQAIWQAGVDAVDSSLLVRQAVAVHDRELQICEAVLDLQAIGRIIVVGAGKAGAGMSLGLQQALGAEVCQQKRLQGWVNVPADCVTDCGPINLHAARPAGVNEPRAEGVAGSAEIIRLVDSATEDDLVLCLLSGGGSALLPAPVEGVTLEDKQVITRLLSGAGANIVELNTVRKQLSQLKGGGLAKRCRGKLLTLIISDVIGDPLDVIASGPTVANPQHPSDAWAVLEKFNLVQRAPKTVLDYLQSAMRDGQQKSGRSPQPASSSNFVIGNNAVAVDAAGMEAERRGYSHAMWSAVELEGDAEGVGRHMAEMIVRMKAKDGPDCLITGGEPTVKLAPEESRGRGGRNQQLVLAAMQRLHELDQSEGFAILSGGTDGEDGPTDAAGACCCATEMSWLAHENRQQELDLALQNNDAYTLLDKLDALLMTGPTHTNVCDLRVAVVDRIQPHLA